MRSVPIFLTIYALLLATVTVASMFVSEAMNVTYAAAAMLYLAVVSWRKAPPFEAPGKSYFRLLFWCGSVIALVMMTLTAIERPSSPDGPVRVGLILATFVGWLFVCARGGQWLARNFYQTEKPAPNSAHRWSAVGVMAAGAVVQLATLFLKITFTNPGTGWNVVRGKESWITGSFNFATAVFFGPDIKWIAIVFGPTGRAFYVLGLCSAVALLVLLALRKGSLERILASRAFRPIAAIQILFCGYLVTDFCWGAETLNAHRILSTLALVCWLAGIVAVLYVVRGIVTGKADAFQLAMLVGLMTPFAMTQAMLVVLMLLADSPGLIALDIGALVSAFGCLAGLSDTFGVVRAQGTGATAIAA